MPNPTAAQYNQKAQALMYAYERLNLMPNTATLAQARREYNGALQFKSGAPANFIQALRALAQLMATVESRGVSAAPVPRGTPVTTASTTIRPFGTPSPVVTPPPAPSTAQPTSEADRQLSEITARIQSAHRALYAQRNNAGTPEFQAAFAEARSVKQAAARVARPAGVSDAVWTAFVNMRTALNNNFRQQRRATPSRSGGGGGGVEVTDDLNTGQDTGGGSGVGTTASGIADAWSQAFRTVFGLTSDTTVNELALTERLRAAGEILNPTGDFTAKPWFWPTIILGVGFLGYRFYTASLPAAALPAAPAPAAPVKNPRRRRRNARRRNALSYRTEGWR